MVSPKETHRQKAKEQRNDAGNKFPDYIPTHTEAGPILE
jgi:hypothetical protein